MLIPFTKMHGLGNDFVLLDERDSSFGLTVTQIAQIADRRYGIGCDQILSLRQSSLPGALASYRIFNADGSVAEHCGNGVRCVARYLCDNGDVQRDRFSLEVRGIAYELILEADGAVRVNMGAPLFSPSDIPISADSVGERYELSVSGETHQFGCVSIGNPHATMVVDDVVAVDVKTIGSALQNHRFFPQKVNVGFMQFVDPGRIKLRVFERGVGETLACGTGACAAVAIGVLWGQLDNSVDVDLPGGTLHIEWAGKTIAPLWMTGPAESVFKGTIEL
ncbi:MAG TPA: diaminopimelate epimerase [Gammaproteobacteria bacterium]|nr:diaminopimelate epimerase [Gammaproteobacteria bacterium]|tara:strand:- start:508 stop:1341 length:834 start_codon:yes stop_codon:yes gene_type:complete